jgi:methylated-DNA-[protein]-cysteine S-methyltransferase
MLTSTTMASPVGVLTLVAGNSGLRYVLWEGETRTILRDSARRDDASVGDDDPAAAAGREQLLSDAVTQLDEYFAGERIVFDVALDPLGTTFQRSVWDVLRTIPYGATMSYGEQARKLGDPNKARAVGAANGRNPLSIVVPCHRVVGSNGTLTGFAGGLDAKAWLLDHERNVLATR